MNFLESIFDRLKAAGAAEVVREIHAERVESVSGRELLDMVAKARGFLRAAGLKKGDRCALLAPNSIRWIAADLALMSEGILAVPLYARQSPAELAGMMNDCGAARLLCSSEALAKGITAAWPGMPSVTLFDEIFGLSESATDAQKLTDVDPVTIIYTSGTSGEPKGVVLAAKNLNHMIPCTNARLDQLMAMHAKQARPDQVFHYLPLCFAGSWILLLTCLSRNSVLSLSTDLDRLADEMKIAAPDYSLNVPTLLERMRGKIESQITKRGNTITALFARAKAAYARRETGKATIADSAALALARFLLFNKIRKMIGTNLKALICGSAPLAMESQSFFMMLGIPVLQVYGLTETTAICTLDDPHHGVPGFVGPAIPGIEMKCGDDNEILVRGANIFSGYWGRPEATAQALRDGWLHTGDQGEVGADGNWRIAGRMKNLIVLRSGHKLAPEPMEEELKTLLPSAQHVMLVGNSRGYLTALVSGQPSDGLRATDVQQALDRLNATLAHYRQVRAFFIPPMPFSIENGLLTANGKLKRDAILARLGPSIEELYRKKTA